MFEFQNVFPLINYCSILAHLVLTSAIKKCEIYLHVMWVLQAWRIIRIHITSERCDLSLPSVRVLAFSVNVLLSCVCCVCQSCTMYSLRDHRRGVSTVSTWLDLEEEVGKALWRILDVLTCSTTAIFCANIQGQSKSYRTVTKCYIE